MMLIVPQPASARISDNAQAYLQARAAAMNGDHARSAELLAALAEAQPDQIDIARKALGEAIGSGQMDLALRLSQRIPATKLPIEARLLLVADSIKRGRIDRAQEWLTVKGDTGDLTFMAPLLTAWDFVGRGDVERALNTIDTIPPNTLLGPLRAEERAFILLKFHRAAEAEPFARRAIGAAGGRENGLRLAFADGFLASGDRDRALAMIEGMGAEAAIARQRVVSGKNSGHAIDTLPQAFSESLMAFVGDLARLQRGSPPVGLAQVARYANPQNTEAIAVLALLLDQQLRGNEALTLLRSVPRDDPQITQILDVETKILTNDKKLNEAFAIASAAASASNASIPDYSRLGDVYDAMKRYDLAAAAYSKAVVLARAQGLKADLWPILLLEASALEQANRWPETRAALQEALAIAPEQPLLLNFMGYAELEHGENLDAAEAMIRKASDLAPDDASITDSLGWALFKRGKVDDAIATLQQAAEKDPEQAEIQEHLGDALYRSGRKFEARFAWQAALVTAENDMAGRVKAKLTSGLTIANAAP